MSLLFAMFLQVLALFSPVAQAADGPSMIATPDRWLRPSLSAPSGGWWQEDGLYLRVYASMEDRQVASRLATAGNRELPRLSKRLGLPIGTQIDVYLAPTQADFSKLQPGVPPDWADGTAWPQHGLIFLRSPSVRPGTAEPLEQVLKHELVHILVGRAFGHQIPPHWLQEGLASYIAGEVTYERTGELGSHMPNTLLNFAALEQGFPRDPLLARLAYAQSGDLVAFLAARHGDASLGALVREMAEGTPMTVALRRVMGESPVQMEREWMERWENPIGKLPALGGLLAGAGMTVAGVLAIRRIRRRNQQKLERWEREEQLMLQRMAERKAMLEQERLWRERRREQQMQSFRVYH